MTNIGAQLEQISTSQALRNRAGALIAASAMSITAAVGAASTAEAATEQPAATSAATPIACEDVTVIAHRGLGANVPENTAESFLEALTHGANGVETDARKTRGSLWVENHDPSWNRTTHSRGMVAGTPSQKVKNIRTREGNMPIITVPETIALVGQQQAELQQEFKVRPDKKAANKFVQQADAAGLHDKVIVTSVDLGNIDPFRHTLTTGFITLGVKEPNLHRLKKHGVDWAMVNGNTVRKDPNFVVRANSLGIQVMARYMTPEEAASYGVPRILTDKPVTCQTTSPEALVDYSKEPVQDRLN